MDEHLSKVLHDRTISLGDEEAVRDVLARAVFGLWEIVNDLTRIRPTKRERFQVTIFGSARTLPGTDSYGEAKRIAAALTKMGCDIITGGGPGMMQAANEGAVEADGEGRTRSVGIRVDLPFEQEVNPFVEQVFEHGTFFTRLHHFVLASDAFIVTPGGIGTLLETVMVWQLLQVRHVDDVPLILIGDIWASLVEWAKEHMLTFDPQLASTEDLDIPTCVPTVDDAVALIAERHAAWLKRNV